MLRKEYTSLVWSSWNSCLLQWPSASIPRIIYFLGHQLVYKLSLGLVLLLRWIQESNTWSFVAQRLINNRGLSHGIEVFLEVSFPIGKTLQIAWSMSPESILWKDCSTKTRLFLTEAFGPLQPLKSLSFYGLWVKDLPQDSSTPGILRLPQSSKIYELSKVWIQDLLKTNHSSFGWGIWKASTNVASCVLVMSLVY